MVGMLYSLIALGFVLIYKASGVFNFAQGAMVLFAALAMARFAEWIPQLTGHRQQDRRQRDRLRDGGAADGRRRVAGAEAGARPARQPGRHHAADGDARHHLLPRGRRPGALRQQHLQDRRRPAEGPDVPVRQDLPGRHARQSGRPRRGRRSRPPWSWCSRCSSRRPRPAVRCAPSPTTTRPRSRSAFRSTASGSSSGRSPASSRWSPAMIWGSKLGVQFSLSLIALKALPVVILGGLTSIPGAIIGGLLIGVGEKLSEIYIGPLVGGGIEIWFAYVLALAFLLIRPQGPVRREDHRPGLRPDACSTARTASSRRPTGPTSRSFRSCRTGSGSAWCSRSRSSRCRCSPPTTRSRRS